MTAATSDAVRRYRRTLLVLVVLLPLAVALIGCAALLVALPQLPQQVLLHWGVSGTRAGSPLVALICLPVTALLGTAIHLLVRRPEQVRRTAKSRLIVAVPAFIACFLTISLIGSVVLQARPGAPVPGLPIVLGALVGVLAAVAVGATMPEPPVRPEPAKPTVVPRSGEEDRVAWFGHATASPALLGVVIGFLGIIVVGVVIAGLASGTAAWAAALLPATVLAAVVSMLSWRVRVDRTGVTAIGSLGFPRVSVPAAEIAGASVVALAPLGDFGGYGLRYSGRATGVVTRAGDALEVVRHDGRRLVLSVDGAADAAGVARALLASAHH